MTQETPETTTRDAAEYHFEEFIKALGLDPETDEHLEDTPARVTRSRFDEIFRGLNEDPSEHLETTFNDIGTYKGDSGWVIVDGIQVQSMCAHHFLPFRGKAHVGYIPDGKAVGLSKLSRVVDGFARRPQVQERLTNQVANAIEESLEPKAAIVVIEAEHECMSLRGVQEPETMTRTSALRGMAHPKHDEHKAHLKEEFFNLVNNRRM